MNHATLSPASAPRAPRRTGIPTLIGGADTVPLTRTPLGKGGGGEAWLQALIHAHPHVLPLAAIEPGFGELVPIARELRCGHGCVDNLLITPQGQLVLVETKLWSNPQARREVIAQALDYVSALMAMGLEAFERAVQSATGSAASLHARIAAHAEALEETAFNDALARNLALGRMLVMVVGDGISEESERLAGLLQGPVAAHFSLALVELGVWEVGTTGQRLVVPSTIARTVVVERGVVRADGAGVRVEPPKMTAPSLPAPPRTISQEEFDACMEQRRPGLADDIRAFIAQVEPLGAYVDWQASLVFKVDRGGDLHPVNLGYIQRNGQLKTTAVEWFAPPDIARRYLDRLAAVFGGTVAHTQHDFVTLDGKSAPRIEEILPAHADAWRDAIAALIRELAERARG